MATAEKYKALAAYYKVIQERSRRTRLIVERDLLRYNTTESWDKSRLHDAVATASEATALATKLRVFMQIMAREEFKCLLDGIARDIELRTSIENLKAARARGCRSLAEALPQQPASKKARHDYSVAHMPGAEMLSDEERRLCEDRRLAPQQYLSLKAACIREQQQTGAAVVVSRLADALKVPRDVLEAAAAYFARCGWIARPQDEGREGKHRRKHRHPKTDTVAPSVVAPPPPLDAAPAVIGVPLPPASTHHRHRGSSGSVPTPVPVTIAPPAATPGPPPVQQQQQQQRPQASPPPPPPMYTQY